ncbi:MAG: hypothetical protein OCC49_04575 [Fibrobacterales bacterium]
MARINWIPGWGSCFSIWKDEIEARFPQHQHIFWKYDELNIFEEQELLESITVKFRNDIFIGWSLGSQLIMEHHESFAHIPKVILIAPIFNFCEKEFGWTPRVINRMIKGLATQKTHILQQFSKNMGENKAQKPWIEYAEGLSTKSLIWGLEKLKNGAITSISGLTNNSYAIFGNNDPIVSPKLIEKFTETFDFITFTRCDTMDHWPMSIETCNRIEEIINE